MGKINYREDQREIMKYRKGTMAVPAVPGAGKTFIVTRLVFDLLESEIQNREKILILTYMNSAVNNFKGRIKKLIDEKYGENDKENMELSDAISGLKSDMDNSSEMDTDEGKKEKRRLINSYEVMTIHSLATKIIKEKPEAVMLNEDFKIADDLQKSETMNYCIRKYLSTEKGMKYFRHFIDYKDYMDREDIESKWRNGFYDMVSKAISSLKYNGITPEKLNDRVNEDGYNGIMIIVSPIYTMYNRELKMRGMLDFDDLLIKAYEIIKNEDDIRLKLQKKYKYIFEDECQDSNEIQGKIIKLISGENGNLVRVGDINQSISGTFSESSPEFFREFIENAESCYRMDMSNRSSADIIELANDLVDYVTSGILQEDCRNALEDMKIKTVPKGMGYKENPDPDSYRINIKWYENATFDDEIKETVRFIKGIKKKYKDKSIGILVPFNVNIGDVSKELKRNEIEFESLGGISEKRKKIIFDIAEIMDFICECDDTGKLLNIFENVFMVEIDEDLIVKLSKHSTEEIIYEGVCKSLNNEYNDELNNAVKVMNLIMENSLLRVDRLISFIGNYLTDEYEELALIDYAVFYIRNIIKENRYLGIEECAEIIRDKNNKIFRHILEIVSNIDGYEPGPGSVTVCTYHKAKGMEWDCVFLLSNNSYIFPSNIKDKFMGDKYYLKEKYKNPEALIAEEIEKLVNGLKRTDFKYENKIEVIKEKIRLLYVGITRAKEMLIFSGCDYQSERDRGKYKRIQKKSDYLKVLEKEISIKRRNA